MAISPYLSHTNNMKVSVPSEEQGNKFREVKRLVQSYTVGWTLLAYSSRPILCSVCASGGWPLWRAPVFAFCLPFRWAGAWEGPAKVGRRRRWSIYVPALQMGSQCGRSSQATVSVSWAPSQGYKDLTKSQPLTKSFQASRWAVLMFSH